MWNKETLEDLIKQLSSPEVLKRGEELNKQFNSFTVEELYRPFNI